VSKKSCAEHRYHYHFNYNLFCRHTRDCRHILRSHIHGTLYFLLVEKYNPKGVPFLSKEDQDQFFDLLNDLVDVFGRDEQPTTFKTNCFWPWLLDLCEVK
jgi:hypothetical protein